MKFNKMKPSVVYTITKDSSKNTFLVGDEIVIIPDSNDTILCVTETGSWRLNDYDADFECEVSSNYYFDREECRIRRIPKIDSLTIQLEAMNKRRCFNDSISGRD